MLNTIVFDIAFWENFQMLKWIPFSNKLERLAFFIQQKANSREARMGLYFFSALESIIIPIPTDPLMAACIYAAPKRWWQIAFLTASFSVLGGLIGWGVGWFFGDFISLPFDGQAADICGRIRASLARRGTPIGPYDFQIAAIALANNLILVTHNVDEFSRVEGLRIEDWEI